MRRNAPCLLLAYVPLFLLASLVPAFAETISATSSMSYKGDVSFDIAVQYSAGETLSAKIRAANMEPVPIADAYILVQLVAGCSTPTYPTQTSDCDNILYEKRIDDVNLAANSEKEYDFEYVIPSNIKPGTYRMDVSFLTKKTPISGLPYVGLEGAYKSFEIRNPGGGTFPEAKILRTKTEFANATGPVGAGVPPASTVPGEVYVQNTAGSALSGAELFIGLCDWDDNACSTYLWSNKYPATIAPGETKKIDVSFESPKAPSSAYSIRLELRAGDGKPVSIYKHRIVTFGEGAKIRKLTIDKPYYLKGTPVTASVLTGTSPDHYTNPDTSNVVASVSVKNADTGASIFSGEETIPLLSSNQNIIFDREDFSFSAPEIMKKFEVCASLASKGGRTKYDEYCYVVDSKKFATGARVYSLVNYTHEGGTLKPTFCIADSSGIPANSDANFLLVEKDKSTIAGSVDAGISECGTILFGNIKAGEYNLFVNDKTDKKQTMFEVKVDAPKETAAGAQAGDDNRGKGLLPGNLKYLYYIVAALILLIIGGIAIKQRMNNRAPAKADEKTAPPPENIPV